MSRTEKIVIVIPALNEEEGIAGTLKGLAGSFRNYDARVLVVDGGSSDRTVKLAKEHGANVIFQFGKGYGDALLTGFLYGLEALAATLFVTVDADGSYVAEDLPGLVEPILKGDADYVVGRRLIEGEAMNRLNRVGNWVISWMTRRLLKIPVRDSQTGAFAFRSYLIGETNFRTKGWAVNTELLKEAAEMGMAIKESDVRYRPRIGDSKLAPLSGGLANISVILRMMRDAEPLLLFGMSAILFTALGLLTGAGVVIEWILKGTITHVGTAIFSALSVIVGIQLLAFGLLADMIKQGRRKSRPRSQLNYKIA